MSGHRCLHRSCYKSQSLVAHNADMPPLSCRRRNQKLPCQCCVYMFGYLYTCMAALIIVFSISKGKTLRNKGGDLPALPSMYPHFCAIVALSRLSLDRC